MEGAFVGWSVCMCVVVVERGVTGRGLVGECGGAGAGAGGGGGAVLREGDERRPPLRPRPPLPQHPHPRLSPPPRPLPTRAEPDGS
eukprot:3599760-Rhodomonas_salina.1